MILSKQNQILKLLFDKREWMSTREIINELGMEINNFNVSAARLKQRGLVDKEIRLVPTTGITKINMGFWRIRENAIPRAREFLRRIFSEASEESQKQEEQNEDEPDRIN